MKLTQALLIGVLLASLTACSRPESTSAKTNTSQDTPPIVPVAHIKRANIASRAVLTAEFQPFQEVDVMAKVAGYVRSIKVDLGDHVRQGQVLAELEIPEMTDDVTRAAAMVEQTGAEIATARDEVQRAESTHQIAHLSFTRLQEVAQKEPGLIPRQEVDEIRSRDLIAEAQLASAKSKLHVEEQKRGVAKADEARIRTLRNYVTITAPFAGTVTKRYANNGAMIQAGIASQSQAMPLVRLSQLSTLRLSLPVPESIAAAVRPGQRAQVRVQSLASTFEGQVARFSEKVDPSTRTMIAELDVANPKGLMLPGMYAEVELQLKPREDVLATPLEAVERAGSATRLYVVDPSGAVRIVPVQLGLEDAHRAEIVSGVKEGDSVIIGRRSGLNAGDKVQTKVIDAVP